MSDVYFNCLTIRGSARGVAEFRKRNEETDSDEHGKVAHHPLSFNALVPYPEKDLGIPLSGAAESLYHVLYSSDDDMRADGGVRHARLKGRKALAAYFTKKEPEAPELAKQYRHNIEKYGHATFFTWFPDKWGPNHDLGDGTQWHLFVEQPSPNELVYSFETNWSIPDRWLMAVAKLFPKLCFTLTWEGADSLRTGLIVYRHGKQTTFVHRDMWHVESDDPDFPSGSYIRFPEGPPAESEGPTDQPAEHEARPRIAQRRPSRKRAANAGRSRKNLRSKHRLPDD